MTNHTSTAAADFLTANQINTLADLPTGQWPSDATADQMADVMLANWTFDGALTPDRAELVAAIRALAE